MLGTIADAEDALQECWIRLDRRPPESRADLRPWLTTVIGRICLDVLRKRRTHRQRDLDHLAPGARRRRSTTRPRRPSSRPTRSDWPCSWSSRRSAPASGWRSCSTTCSASRTSPSLRPSAARRRRPASSRAARADGSATHGWTGRDPDVAVQRPVVDAFLAAARHGELGGLLELLDYRRDPAHRYRRPPRGSTRADGRSGSRGHVPAIECALLRTALPSGPGERGRRHRRRRALDGRSAWWPSRSMRGRIRAIDIVADPVKLSSDPARRSPRSSRRRLARGATSSRA